MSPALLKRREYARRLVASRLKAAITLARDLRSGHPTTPAIEEKILRILQGLHGVSRELATVLR